MANIFNGGAQEENTGNIPESTGTLSLAGLLNVAALSSIMNM